MKKTILFGLVALFHTLVACSSNVNQEFELSNPASVEW
jgi:hypothetical protein